MYGENTFQLTSLQTSRKNISDQEQIDFGVPRTMKIIIPYFGAFKTQSQNGIIS